MDNMENVEVKGNPEDFFLSRVYTEIMEEDLVVPGVSDYQIIDYVRDSIVLKDINYSGCFVPSPLLVQKNIALSSIKNAYGIEASDLAKTLLNNIEIRKTGNKHEYHINSISNEPVSMTVPSTTNTLSHIYIARDAIEGIKNVNKSEYSLKYKCGNVITIFHELMEAFNNNDKKCDFIINRRLATLKGECIEDMEEIYDASNYDCDHTRAVLHQNNVHRF